MIMPFDVEEFDKRIEKTVPYYFQFYEQTIDLVETLNYKNAYWLDTGCGTGKLVLNALNKFSNFKFILCDPSSDMIELAKTNLKQYNQILEFNVCSSQRLEYCNQFNIITAIQSHHYMKYDERIIALNRCFNALKENGIFIFFENFAPDNEESKNIILKRWGHYQMQKGKSENDVKNHLNRYNKDYFPITISDHYEILRDCNFRVIQIFWLSYMQVGIYAIK